MFTDASWPPPFLRLPMEIKLMVYRNAWTVDPGEDKYLRACYQHGTMYKYHLLHTYLKNQRNPTPPTTPLDGRSTQPKLTLHSPVESSIMSAERTPPTEKELHARMIEALITAQHEVGPTWQRQPSFIRTDKPKGKNADILHWVPSARKSGGTPTRSTFPGVSSISSLGMSLTGTYRSPKIAMLRQA